MSAAEADGIAIADRVAITDLLFHYAYCIDSAQPARLNEVFAEDVLAEYGYGEREDDHAWRGSAELIAGISAQVAQFEASAHAISNVRVSADANLARSTAYVCGWHWLPAPGSDPFRPADFMFTGVYVDGWRRQDEGWRIVHRRFRRLGPSSLAVGRAPDFMRARE
jgi:hypothetical protein